MPGFPKEIFREAAIIEGFLCCVCTLVFRDAVQNPCGHRYCDSCIRQIAQKKDSSERRCPACPENSAEGILVLDEIYPDFVARRGLKNQPVKCINEGCNWTGKFNDYSQEHEASCPYEKVKCLKSGCGKTINRGNLSHHLERECPMRLIECKNCKKQYPYKEIKKHTSECPDAPVTCSSCNKRVPRSQMNNHLNPETGDCLKRKTKCIFHPFGCNAKVIASALEEHMIKNLPDHNQMLVDAILSGQKGKERGLENGFEDVGKGKLSPVPSGSNTSSGSLSLKAMEREILRLERDLKKMKTDVEAKVMAKLEKSVAEKLAQTDTMIAVLDNQAETIQQVVAMLSNQMSMLHSKTVALEKQSAFLKEVTEKQEKRLQAQDQMLTLKNVALAEADLRMQALENSSYDSVLLWKISEYKRRKQDAISGRTTSFYSPVFYTSRHGYKLAARIYLNGDGMGKQTHLSLFFVVMQGRHDALLPWPFQQKVTFMLVDQGKNRDHIVDAFRPDPTSSSFKRPTTEMNIASGCPLFVSQEILERGDTYVKDDALFIKVSVETNGLEPL